MIQIDNYESVRYLNIHVYDGLGLVSVGNELMIPVHRSDIRKRLSVFQNDWFWMRSYVNNRGRRVFGLEATTCDGRLYRTVSVDNGEMISCIQQVCVVQRALALLLMRKKLAAIRALRKLLSDDLVKLCLTHMNRASGQATHFIVL
jgi:hypothetical protein